MPKSIGEEVITELVVEGQGSLSFRENSGRGTRGEEAGVLGEWQEMLVVGKRVQW